MSEAKTKFIKKFASRLNELRGGRSQAEFAEFLGISRPTVGFYENGERIPDAFVLSRIAQKCGVTTDYLVGLSDNKTIDSSNIGKTTGLSDDAIKVLCALSAEKKCYKKYNDYQKYYASDALNYLLENLNYSSRFLMHLTQMLNIDLSFDSFELEDLVMDESPDLYSKIYSHGTIIAGSEYKRYLETALENEFYDLVSLISRKVNPTQFEEKMGYDYFADPITVCDSVKDTVEFFETRDTLEAGDKNGDR